MVFDFDKEISRVEARAATLNAELAGLKRWKLVKRKRRGLDFEVGFPGAENPEMWWPIRAGWWFSKFRPPDETIELHLRRTISTAEDARQRHRYFWGRLFNNATGVYADYIRTDRQHLFLVLELLGEPMPKKPHHFDICLVRLDAVYKARAILLQRIKASAMSDAGDG